MNLTEMNVALSIPDYCSFFRFASLIYSEMVKIRANKGIVLESCMDDEFIHKCIWWVAVRQLFIISDLSSV